MERKQQYTCKQRLEERKNEVGSWNKDSLN